MNSSATRPQAGQFTAGRGYPVQPPRCSAPDGLPQTRQVPPCTTRPMPSGGVCVYSPRASAASLSCPSTARPVRKHVRSSTHCSMFFPSGSSALLHSSRAMVSAAARSHQRRPPLHSPSTRSMPFRWCRSSSLGSAAALASIVGACLTIGERVSRPQSWGTMEPCFRRGYLDRVGGAPVPASGDCRGLRRHGGSPAQAHRDRGSAPGRNPAVRLGHPVARRGATLARIRHRFGISSSLCWYWTRIGSRYPLWVVRRYARGCSDRARSDCCRFTGPH